MNFPVYLKKRLYFIFVSSTRPARVYGLDLVFYMSLCGLQHWKYGNGAATKDFPGVWVNGRVSSHVDVAGYIAHPSWPCFHLSPKIRPIWFKPNFN